MDWLHWSLLAILGILVMARIAADDPSPVPRVFVDYNSQPIKAFLGRVRHATTLEDFQSAVAELKQQTGER